MSEFIRSPINLKGFTILGVGLLSAYLGVIALSKVPPPVNSNNARTSGGQAETAQDWSNYNQRDTSPYCDKHGHLERSIAHAPQHIEHWKKINKKVIK
jgi:hypothetical protein